MRSVVAVLLLILAPWLQAAPMGEDAARHLLNRTGFGATPQHIRDFAALSREAAVDRLLAGVQSQAQTPPPAWSDEHFSRPRGELSEDEKRALQQRDRQMGIELRSWWLREMLDTPSPLTERMTLFWHNHFVSSLQKVKPATYMYRQNVLLRHHALGNFGRMLHAVARDPAMVIYLDNQSNRKQQPNENFAREVMELFTLGEGHYSERDVKEAARAFTGWMVNRETDRFEFRPQAHDDGEKTVLGQSGPLDGGDVLEILLAQPATAEFVVGKLWRELVSSQPDPREIKRLAELFRRQHYEIKPLLRALLTADAFYAPQQRAALIKSPVDLVVGTLRAFGVQGDALSPLALTTRRLGQDLFAPPNVKGWPGGESWINSSTLLIRKQWLEQLLRDEPSALPPPNAMLSREERQQQRADRGMALWSFDFAGYARQFSGSPRQQREAMRRHVLATPPQAEGGEQTGLGYLRRLVLDPAYQLK